MTLSDFGNEYHFNFQRAWFESTFNSSVQSAQVLLTLHKEYQYIECIHKLNVILNCHKYCLYYSEKIMSNYGYVSYIFDMHAWVKLSSKYRQTNHWFQLGR